MMKLLVPLLTLVAATLPRGYSQNIPLGQCPNVNVQQNFNIIRYMGIWYQWGSNGTQVQGKGKCVQAEYKLNSTTGKVDVINLQKTSGSLSLSSISGYLTYMDPKKQEGKFLITLKLGQEISRIELEEISVT